MSRTVTVVVLIALMVIFGVHQSALSSELTAEEKLNKEQLEWVFAEGLNKHNPDAWDRVTSPDYIRYCDAMPPELQELLAGETPIEKTSFSCWETSHFETRVRGLNRKRALVAGIEAHVCVYQTAADLFANGWHVEVVADAVSSRTPGNLQIGLEHIKTAGASLTSVETAVFELMRTAEHPAFRDILKLIK